MLGLGRVEVYGKWQMGEDEIRWGTDFEESGRHLNGAVQ